MGKSLIIGLGAVSLIAAMVLAPLLAYGVASIILSEAQILRIGSGTLDASLKATANIPQDGSIAAGVGILTATGGTNAIMVTTTHAGVQDSIKQTSAADPIFHNHYVKLKADPANCGSDPAVDKITFEEPGSVSISGKTALMTAMPASFTGTDALTSLPLTLSPGLDASAAVSFNLLPLFDVTGALLAVCVTDITPIDISQIVGGEILSSSMVSLFVAGAAANSFWIVPLLVGAGVIGYMVRKMAR
jgi:hypothetical protein